MKYEDLQYAIENLDLSKKENLEYWKGDWEQRRCMVVVQVICYVVYAIYMKRLHMHSQYIDKSITQKSVNKENIWMELMKELTLDERCRNVIYMGPYVFAKLVEFCRETD